MLIFDHVERGERGEYAIAGHGGGRETINAEAQGGRGAKLAADLNKNIGAKKWEHETIRNYMKLVETNCSWEAGRQIDKIMGRQNPPPSW